MDFRSLAQMLGMISPGADYPRNTTTVPKNEVDRAAIINQIMQGMNRPPRARGDMPHGKPMMMGKR